MGKINTYISAVLMLIIIILSIYIFIKNSIDNKIIDNLQKENKALLLQVSSAETLIDLQNNKVRQFEIDMVSAEEKYMEEISRLDEKYKALKSKYKNESSYNCSEILNIINENQRRFIYEESN